jgi:hypothetical protein
MMATQLWGSLLGLGILLCACTARADVRLAGTWPDDEVVSLSAVGGTRSDAVRALGQEAGWSLVVQDLGDTPVDVEVQGQPAAKVLGLILTEGDFVATRDGDLVSVARSAPSGQGSGDSRAPERTPLDASSSPRGKKGEVLVTDYVRIGPDDVVTDVIVWSGRVDVAGHVQGGIGAFGGQVHLLPGGRVDGDVVAFGGSIDIEDGADVGGEVAPVFASLERGEHVDVVCSTCMDEPVDSKKEFFDRLFERLTGASLFWVFGALLVAGALPRVERVKAEIVRRPLRCLGFGVLGLLGLILIVATLAVTLIGIPLAVLVAVLAMIAGYVGFCIAVYTAGGLLLRQRSNNPYLRLAVGALTFFLTQWVPGLDGIVCVLGLLVAIGALVLTRGAGLFARRPAHA